MEWVVAFIFVPLGMWFVRMTVARLSNLSDESKANEAIVGRPPKVKPQAVILLIVAFGAFVTAAVIFRNHYAPEPPPPRQSAIAGQGR